MPLSAAEKQRRYRARRDADPERRQTYLEKERLSWKKKKSTGNVKQIIQLSERAKRSVRKRWRDAQKKSRGKDKETNPTPLETPHAANKPSTSTSSGSRQKKQAQKMRCRQTAKCYRDLEKARQVIINQERVIAKYKKKRCQRAQQAVLVCKKNTQEPNEDTVKTHACTKPC